MVIFSHKYSLSDRVILGVVGQPNFFVAKKSTLNGGRLLIISWQGRQFDNITFEDELDFDVSDIDQIFDDNDEETK